MSYSMHYPPVWLFHVILKVYACGCCHRNYQQCRELKCSKQRLTSVARRDKNSLVCPILPHYSLLISQQDEDDGQTDGQTHPSISSPCCGNLPAILSGCISAARPIFINTSIFHLQARCGTALRDVEGRSAVYQASVPSMSLAEVTTAWALSSQHTRTRLYVHTVHWSMKTHSSSTWKKMQTWNLTCVTILVSSKCQILGIYWSLPFFLYFCFVCTPVPKWVTAVTMTLASLSEE